jgi:hypothetical protein
VTAKAETTVEEVLAAGRLLFGPAFGAHARGWREALRATYRRRALETHPDRARALGRAETDLAREFHAVQDAYRVLSTVREWPAAAAPARPRGVAPQRPPPSRPHAGAGVRRAETRATPAGDPGRAPHVRVRVGVSPGALPRRRLRLAEYLYYAGYVPWSALVEAVAWQRAQRPPLGRVAVEFGFLAPAEIAEILERRRAAGAGDVPFGEFAVREGYLTPFQLLASLGQQLRRERRIGVYFVERGLLDEAALEEAHRRLARHNTRQR